MPRKLKAERYANGASPSLGKFITERLPYLSFSEAMQFYMEAIPRLKPTELALLGCNDRFFLLTGMLNRPDAIHPWLYDRMRELEADPDGYLDLWARFHGKAVDVNEPVPTPNGWVPHGDLRSGDSVYGPDGKPTRVVARTEVFHDADCYRVTFCDGYSVVVSGEHLWTVDLQDRSRVNGSDVRKKWQTVTIDTRQLAAEVERSAATPSRRYPAIPVASAVQRPDADLLLDPYVLGCWLGDGHAKAATMTTSWEDWPQFKGEFEKAGHAVQVAYDRGNCLGYRVDTRDIENVCMRGHAKTPDNVYVSRTTGARQCKICKHEQQRAAKYGDVRSPRVLTMAEKLRQLGLLDASSPPKKIEKRIPPQYLTASEDQRWALLQGLMDTDGHCHKDHAQCQFVSVLDGLADDVFDLCQSLGLKATKVRRSVLYKGERRPFWQVQFLGRRDKAPFRLPRKIERCTDAPRDNVRRVKSVEQVASRPVSCIQVERKDGLYLIGRNYVTTHNSSTITFAGIIQEILCDPEIRVCIFSNTADIAVPFLKQIKEEFEANEALKLTYPDVLWMNPTKEAKVWSVQDGIIVKRKGNAKEATVEAHGLINALPTGRHFPLLVYDDAINERNVTNPEQIRKAMERIELSFPLGIGAETRKWFVGTRYHFGDAYGQLLEREIVKPRIYPATEDGRLDGKPVFMSPEAWEKTKREMRSTIAAQMLQNPVAGLENIFRTKWLRPYYVRPILMNVYIMGDPSKGRNKTSDRTALAVVGIDSQGNKYLLDGYCHRMPLSERWSRLSELHTKWSRMPGVQLVKVGYERYGSQSDDEYFEEKMRASGKRFDIEELNWTGERGRESKTHRVERLEPDFRLGHFFVPAKVWHAHHDKSTAHWYLPEDSDEIHYADVKGLHAHERRAISSGERWRLMEPIRRLDEDGNIYDLVRVFFEEYARFPFSPRDDLIDVTSRIFDMEPAPAIPFEKVEVEDYIDA